MDLDFWAKAVPVVLGAIGAGFKFFDPSGKRGKMREEYRFAREFLHDLEFHPDLHPYAKEKGYQAIAGDTRLGADEIEYLLSLTGPERALRDYVKGRKYLAHVSGNLQIAFKRKYQSRWSRQWRMGLYLAAYMALVLMAFGPLLFSGYLRLPFADSITAFCLCLGVFGPFAWMAVQAGASIYRAQVLVANQSRHTPHIVVENSQKVRKIDTQSRR